MKKKTEERRTKIKKLDIDKLSMANNELDLARKDFTIKEKDIETKELRIRIAQLELQADKAKLLNYQRAADTARKHSLEIYKSVGKKYKLKSESWGLDLEKSEIVEKVEVDG